MLKFSIAFYVSAVILAILVNVGFDGQQASFAAQQMTASELALSSLN
jgi:hypothetical protein